MSSVKTQQVSKSECANPWLCSILGFFLPVIGLIIGAIIGKGDGVKHALGGIVLRYVLVIGSCVAVFSNSGEDQRETSISSRATQESPHWIVSSKKSPIDDSITCIAEIDAVQYSSDDRNAQKRPTLILRNAEGRVEAYIVWTRYLANSKIEVTVRFDNDKAVVDDWSTSTKGDAVFSPFPFGDFFDRVLDSKKLVVRLTPYGRNTETAIFDVSGLSGALGSSAIKAFRHKE